MQYLCNLDVLRLSTYCTSPNLWGGSFVFLYSMMKNRIKCNDQMHVINRGRYKCCCINKIYMNTIMTQEESSFQWFEIYLKYRNINIARTVRKKISCTGNAR